VRRRLRALGAREAEKLGDQSCQCLGHVLAGAVRTTCAEYLGPFPLQIHFVFACARDTNSAPILSARADVARRSRRVGPNRQRAIMSRAARGGARDHCGVTR
jgi:hypothetical protein